jgi:stage III sporulation protein AE
MTGRRCCIGIFWIGVLLLMLAPHAWAAPLPEAIGDQIAALQTGEMEAFLGSLQADLQQELPRFDLASIISGSGSDLGFDLATMMRRLLSFTLREVTRNSHLLGQLVVLAVFCAVLRNLANVFPAQGASDVAFAVSLLTLLYLAIQSFRLVVDVAVDAVDTMVTFMQALLPMMTTMLAAVGAVTTATVFHPLLFVVINVVATIVKSSVLPMVMLAAVLAVLGTLSREFPMKRLAALVRQWALTLLGLPSPPQFVHRAHGENRHSVGWQGQRRLYGLCQLIAYSRRGRPKSHNHNTSDSWLSLHDNQGFLCPSCVVPQRDRTSAFV